MTWKECFIGDFVNAGLADIQTGPFGTQLKASDYVSDGTPVINVRNIGFGNLRADKLEYVGERTTEKLSVHLLRAHDIVFGRKGAVDRHLFVTEDQEKWMQGSDCIRLRFETEEVCPRFVSLGFLRNEHQQWMLAQSGNKATMASLNHDIIKRIRLCLPPRHGQNEIVSVLSAYEDLIENNRQRMGLLEEAARLLYQEWFVRLRFPSHEHTRVDNGLPVGWERRPLDGCAKFLSGGTPSKAVSEFWDGDIPWVSSGELTTMRIHDASLHVTSEAVKAGSRLVPTNTILVVVRGMSLAKEFRMAMTSRPVAFNQDLKALVPQSDVDAVYLFHALETQRDQIRGRATEASHGTKKLDTQALASVPILVPSVRIQEHFREIVDPLNSQWDVLHRQTDKLRSARDLLLPRLMSGEIAV